MQEYEYEYKNKVWYSFRYLLSVKHPKIRGAARGVLKFIEKNKLVKNKHYIFIINTDDDSCKVSNTYSKKLGEILFLADWINDIEPERVHDPLPPILKLSDSEMFKDNHGNVFDVDVRGERHHKKCFFKAKDIANVFKMPSLVKTIIKKGTAYHEDVDYIWFNNLKNKPSLYLTFKGLLRVAMVSRSGNTKTFSNWILESIFATKFGTDIQKAKTFSRALGIDYPTVLAFCSTLQRKISAIYLFQIGIVKNLRTKLDIPDDYPDNAPVYKYGRTNDIRRRFKNHIDNKYSEKNGFNCKLITMWFVSEERLTKAERILKQHLIDKHWYLENDKHTEIAIINLPKKQIVDELNPIFSQYASEINTLENKVSELTTEVILLKKDIEILKGKLREKELELKLMKKS